MTSEPVTTLRLAIVSTYPPRPCGIGTFSRDLRHALLAADPSLEIDVLSIVRDHHSTSEPEVLSVIRQDVRADYVAVPALLDGRGTDVVLIEHEFGIFGGQSGSYVLSLVQELRQPFVVTLHTVLSAPTTQQADVLSRLCHRAALVTVFTETARRMVVEAGVVPADRVRVVPHGAPTALLPTLVGASTHSTSVGDMGATLPEAAPAHRIGHHPTAAHLEGRTVLSTFGLISAGKGIETAIRALAEIVPLHPEVLYLVAGQTHPEVVKEEGERYRLSLERLVRELGLDEHVQFLDRFLSMEELAYLLSSTDLYLTPYRSREQIVSGALTFAVVAGCPVVSTNYFYAEDLLATGAGVLVPFDDATGFAKGILQLLDDPAALEAAAGVARRIGRELAWPAVGAHTVDVLREARELGAPEARVAGRLASSPSVRSDHLLTLVDDVGIVQHADGVVPHLSSGYCVDDMARLVIVAVGLDRESSGRTFQRMITLGLGFLRHAFDPTVTGMHNMMSYDRRWLDAPHNGDHVGRAAWALGVVVAAHPPRAVRAPALRLLTELIPTIEESDSLRAWAFAAIGLSRPPLDALPDDLRLLLRTLGDRLMRAYHHHAREGWRWFEDDLTYDNARLPQALIAAGDRLGDQALLAAGLDSLDWYGKQCGLDGAVVRLVGNSWVRTRHSVAGDAFEGDEQPLDAAALVEALTDAMGATDRRQYGQQAVRAFEWFLGRNRLGEPVYDFASGGSHDGIGSTGMNDNEGAESTLAYFQSLLAIEAAGLQSSLPQS